MFHASCCCVCSTHRLQQALVQHAHQSVSVPIRHPSDKNSSVTSFEADIYIYTTSQIQQNTRYIIRGILMRVAFLGYFPGAWQRGSWYFQVAGLHLQSSMDFSFSTPHYFSFLSKRSGRRMPPAERSALHVLRFFLGGLG